MALRGALKTARDMLAKLETELQRLEQAVTSGDLMNFAITAYHLIEWVQRDPTASASSKTDLDSMRSNTDIAVCRDIANGGKHFELKPDYKNRVTDKTSVIAGGFGVGRFGAGPYGVGEESIVVVLMDGTRVDSLTWARRVLETWNTFFAKHRW